MKKNPRLSLFENVLEEVQKHDFKQLPSNHILLVNTMGVLSAKMKNIWLSLLLYCTCPTHKQEYFERCSKSHSISLCNYIGYPYDESIWSDICKYFKCQDREGYLVCCTEVQFELQLYHYFCDRITGENTMEESYSSAAA